MKYTQITDLELQALFTITQADFYENGRNSEPWDFSVYDVCSIPNRSRSGVYGSLAKKGFIAITEKEKSTYIDKNGVKQKNPYFQRGEPNFGTLRITTEGYELLDSLKLIDADGYFINDL